MELLWFVLDSVALKFLFKNTGQKKRKERYSPQMLPWSPPRSRNSRVWGSLIISNFSITWRRLLLNGRKLLQVRWRVWYEGEESMTGLKQNILAYSWLVNMATKEAMREGWGAYCRKLWSDAAGGQWASGTGWRGGHRVFASLSKSIEVKVESLKPTFPGSGTVSMNYPKLEYFYH